MIRFIYTVLLHIALPFVFIKMLIRSRNAPDYRRRWMERIGVFDTPELKDSIWIHAVSVGETQAAEPLVKCLLEAYPDNPIVMTAMTPTGSDRAKKLFGDRVFCVYCPYDLPFALSNFLNKTDPKLVLLMETEVWPNMLSICQKRKIPTVLGNARLSRQSARRYKRLRGFATSTFRKISFIAAQDQKDADRFQELDVADKQLSITGSIKFDIKVPASLRERGDVLKRSWQDRPVWVAASTHEGEEEIILDAHRQLLEKSPNALLILVPRHPERFDRIAALCEKEGFSFQRRSEQAACVNETQVFLGDTMGELTLFMAASNAAFVGGSLVKVGGHNVLEPAAFGLPVATGPEMFNFSAINQMMQEKEASVEVASAEELADTMHQWLTDAAERSRVGENGRRVIESNRGALDKLCKIMEGYLR